MVVELKNKNGQTLEIEMPQTIEEVSLSGALSFAVIERQIYTVVDEEPFDRIKYLMLVTEAVAEFFDIDVEWLYGMAMGDVESYLRGLKPSYIKKTTDDVLQLFDHILVLFADLKPTLYIDQDFTFEHKGITWKIPHFITNQLQTGLVNPKLTVAEVVEALEVRRLWGQDKEDKNSIFTELVKLTAILARKDGDEFPTDQQEINEFIAERSNIFADMDAKVGLEVGFFLNNIIVI